MMTASVRAMEPEDIPAVLGVMSRALGEPPGLGRTEELWTWKHVDNPFGRSIVLVADVGGRVAGVRAFMRWELVTPNGDRLRCVRAVDTATDPDFHRQGIFRTLTEAAVEEAAAGGVDLIFNTPNPRSGAGYKRMGWSEVGGIRVLARPSWSIVRGSDPELEVLPDAAEGPPASPPPDRDPLGLRTERTPAYLRWRYGSHPTARYRSVTVDGSTAIVRENRRRGRQELVISDLLGPAPGPALRAVTRHSRADYLVGSFPHGSPERRSALAAGMIPVPRVRALTLFARPLNPIPEVARLSSWDITLGDLELL